MTDAAEAEGYDYDVQDQLRQVRARVAGASQVVEVIDYDPTGLPLFRQVGTVGTWYVGKMATVTATVSSSCTGAATCTPTDVPKVAVHLLLGGNRIATVKPPALAATSGAFDEVLYYHRDYQGSVIGTSRRGSGVDGLSGARYRYTPYGQLDRAENVTAATDSELGYTGGLRLGWQAGVTPAAQAAGCQSPTVTMTSTGAADADAGVNGQQDEIFRKGANDDDSQGGFGDAGGTRTKEGKGLDKIDEAAKKALSEINPKSIREMVEYGVAIYRTKDGQIGYTGPVSQGEAAEVAISLADLPKRAELVAIYHTHGAYTITIQLDPNNSSRDIVARYDNKDGRLNYQDMNSCHDKITAIKNANSRGIPNLRSYVGTPSGRFLVYDVSTRSERVLP